MDKKAKHISDVEPRIGASYPGFDGRKKLMLGDTVNVSQFGVNHTTLEPGTASALRHWHEGEDEFIYVLSGTLILKDDNGDHVLQEGCFAGFPAGSRNAHHLVNNSNKPASFIEIGSRKPGNDTVYYPDDNLGPIHR
jgi:uncharacterized cupin superfamily protein